MRNPKLHLNTWLVILYAGIVASLGAACHPDAKAGGKPGNNNSTDSSQNIVAANDAAKNLNDKSKIANAATILARKQVPVLCYHQIRDWKASDSKTARAYIVPPASFAAQIQALADSGYNTINPDQLYNYLAYGADLPSKPVLITFDDTRVDQYNVASKELSKHKYNAAYFIMTVALGKPGYMSKEQVKELSDNGNTIGSHTWDHGNVKKYTAEDWTKQVEKPQAQLKEITGKQIEYFAYPFGLWNREAIAQLKKFDFKAVFQLADASDPEDPLLSVRRIIVPGTWSGTTLEKNMTSSFAKK